MDMKRKFLEDLGLEKDIVDQIMQENGNDINKAKSDYEDVKAQLETANNTIKERDKQLKTLKDSAGDNEELKAQITNLQNSNKENAKKYAEDLKLSFYLAQEPEMFEVLVPNCVYRGGCPEPEPCGWYENFSKQCNESDIRSRYSKYSEYFLEVNKNA